MNIEIEIITEEVRLRPETLRLIVFGPITPKQLFGWQPSYGGREGFRRGLIETVEWLILPENLLGYKADIYNI